MKQLFRVRKYMSVFFALLGTILFFSCNQAIMAAEAPAADQAIGQVVWVKGDVEAVQPDNSKRVLKRRDVILAHDTIVTDASGSGEIVFTDSSVVALRNDTQLKIDEYKFNPKTPGDNKYIASLAKGGFRTITGLISKGHPDNYQVNTPVATIGVRGTIFTAVFNNNRLSLEIIKGAIVATNSAGMFELDKEKTLPYAEILSRLKPAVPLKQAPVVLKSVPAVAPVKAPATSTLQQQVTAPHAAAAGSTTTTTNGGSSSKSGTSGGKQNNNTQNNNSQNNNNGPVVGGTTTDGTGGSTGGTTGGTSSGAAAGSSTTPAVPAAPGSSPSGGASGGKSVNCFRIGG